MTPDIREKAERLALRIDAEASRPGIRGIAYMDLSVTADLISQALLEAHKAGREEAAKVADKNASEHAASAEVLDLNLDHATVRARQVHDAACAASQHIATAIRSIK